MKMTENILPGKEVLTLMEGPSQSPDFNPKENLWRELRL